MHESSKLERRGEPTLRVEVWPHPSPRGCILITQGYAECVERWQHVAKTWYGAGFAVAAYDLRGQGLSGGRRGHVDRFAQLTDDLFAVAEFLRERHEWPSSQPIIGFGHSLGGLITTVAALERPGQFRGLGLASPFYGLALKPPRWKVYLGRKLTNVWPTFTEKTNLDLDLLTHDSERVAMMRADKLRIEQVTARWFTETEAARQRVSRDFRLLNIPVWCLAAGDDHVADVTTTQQIFASSSNVNHELRVVPKAYHELHQELERDVYIEQFQRCFESWCATPNVA
jgi:alpha-beta hydrolase superfamily lysophospholipase